MSKPYEIDEPTNPLGLYEDLMCRIATAFDELVFDKFRANTVMINQKKYAKLYNFVIDNMHMNPCIAGLSVQMANLPDDFDFIIGNYHFVETPRCPHCGGKTVQRGDELYCYSCHMWRKVDETHHAQSE